MIKVNNDHILCLTVLKVIYILIIRFILWEKRWLMASSAPVFSFSSAELVVNLNSLPPINPLNQPHPPRENIEMVKSVRYMKAKLINLLSRPNINKLITLTFNFKNQLPTSTTTLENFSSLNVSKLESLRALKLTWYGIESPQNSFDHLAQNKTYQTNSFTKTCIDFVNRVKFLIEQSKF